MQVLLLDEGGSFRRKPGVGRGTWNQISSFSVPCVVSWMNKKHAEIRRNLIVAKSLRGSCSLLLLLKQNVGPFRISIVHEFNATHTRMQTSIHLSQTKKSVLFCDALKTQNKMAYLDARIGHRVPHAEEKHISTTPNHAVPDEGVYRKTLYSRPSPFFSRKTKIPFLRLVIFQGDLFRLLTPAPPPKFREPKRLQILFEQNRR